MNLRILPFALALACVSFPDTTFASSEVEHLLEARSWGWPTGDNTCEKNPQRLSFSSDGREMTVSWLHTHEPARYLILYREEQSITMFLEKEKRRTDAGDLVIWQLKLVDADHFCWRRTDWPAQVCTKKLSACDSAS